MNTVTPALNSRKRRILDIMADGSEMTVKAVAEAAGVGVPDARYVLNDLEGSGLARKRRCEIAGCVVYQLVGVSAIDRARHNLWTREALAHG